MKSLPASCLLWWRWLVVATASVMLLGAGMVLAPEAIRQFYGLLLYSSTEHIAQFGAGATSYAGLMHAVIGALMLGWGTTLFLMVLGPFRRGSREAWQTLLISIVAWFVPDTAFSLWSGFWPNALLNLLTAMLFVIPLAATYRAFHDAHA